MNSKDGRIVTLKKKHGNIKNKKKYIACLDLREFDIIVLNLNDFAKLQIMVFIFQTSNQIIFYHRIVKGEDILGVL